MVGSRLNQKIYSQQTSCETIIDLGCGAGTTTQELLTLISFKKCYGIDISEKLLLIAREKLSSQNITLAIQSFETFDFGSIKFNLAFSNMALHWSHHIGKTFCHIHANIAENGLFAFSLPLSNTFNELPVSLRNEFQSFDNILNSITEARFELLNVHEESFSIGFPSWITALKSIKATGANYILHQKQKSYLGKQFYKNWSEKAVLTYQIGYFVARKKIMSFKIFVTGTDTNVGKTHISVGILRYLTKKGFKTLGLKPIASGSVYENGQLINEDTEKLNNASSIAIPKRITTPFMFEEPIAPHLAAKNLRSTLSIKELIVKMNSALNYSADIYLFEGAGGWSVPLNKNETMADIAKHYHCKIIMVVGLRLGCINHAILTYQAIKHTNLPLLGWVANEIEPMLSNKEGIIATLINQLPIPLLSVTPYGEIAEDYLLLENLFNDRCIA